MNYVRLMTFNVQLLPNFVPDTLSNLFGTYPSKSKPDLLARKICQEFMKIPEAEKPDIIVLNEAWVKSAKNIIESELSALYPYKVAQFCEDFFIEPAEVLSFEPEQVVGIGSGLMLMSKYPLIQFMDGTMYKFFKYDNATSSDAYSKKGLGLVKIETPIGIVLLALTHTQAFYNSEDEYSNIRKKQLESCIGWIKPLLTGGLSWESVVFVGDFNIRGDKGAKFNRKEWRDAFELSGDFSNHFFDGWDFYMHPNIPTHDFPTEMDPGYTHDNREKVGEDLRIGQYIRLDYQCFGHNSGPFPPVRFAPQHLRTRLRTISDHWSLESDIHLFSDRCTPASGVLWSGLNPVPNQFNLNLRITQLQLKYEGSYQWIYVGEGGSYTIFNSLLVDVNIFSVNDLSTEWKAYGSTTESTLVKDALIQRNIPITGTKYSIPGPFYIRVSSNTVPKFTGMAQVGILRHGGETKETAYYIRSWEPPLKPFLKVGIANGPMDDCWFEADLDQAFVPKEYISDFIIVNEDGVSATGTLINPANDVVADLTDNRDITLKYRSTGSEKLYLLLKRNPNMLDTNFRVGWKSPITYFKSVPGIKIAGLRCIDETGENWMGSDEVNFKVSADEQIFLNYDWNGSDTGEWLSLTDISPEIESGIAFLDNILFSIAEDDFDASSYNLLQINALPENEGLEQAFEKEIGVQSGTYRFEGILSRQR